jgi:NADH-quinone oxidoreductase subunit L
VGLCSYLLIGFWFGERRNADAGKKAFIVNRIGDFGVLIAMFLMWVHFGALDFAGVTAAVAGVPVGGAAVTAIALCLFLGCTGKSAQLPLFVWLPDAMAGPTPVSALIHAATMVTAGVYLVARSAPLFAAAPAASLVVTAIGALTALFAATIGLKQWDIKKVLAYSTVSQLGYMFVGVGVGAYAAGLFHVMTHAFFKALLFLGAGSVIHAMHHAYHATHRHADAQDMRNMGGLRAHLPLTAALMWTATLAIAGIPPLSGFFSKDEILAATFARAHGGPIAEATLFGVEGHVWLFGAWTLCVAAAFLTAVYMTRMMLYTFHGPNRTGAAEREHLHEPGWVMTGPLVVLGVATVAAGWLNLPAVVTHTLPIGPSGVLHHWLEPVVGAAEHALAGDGHLPAAIEWGLLGFAVLIAVAGIATAWKVCRPEALVPADQAVPETGWLPRALTRKWYVDELYAAVIVRPLEALSRTVLWRGIDQGLIDGVMVNGLGWKVPSAMGRLGAALHTGRVGTYAWVLVLGAVAVLTAFSVR